MSRTGSIKRSGSTWGFVLDIGRSNGRRQQVRKRGFRTKKDAQTALNDALAELQHGTYVRPRRITLESYLDDWLASLAIAGRRPTTIAGYRRLIRLHVNPALGASASFSRSPRSTSIVSTRSSRRPGAPADGARSSKSTIRKVHVLIGKALGDAERKGLAAAQRRAPGLSPIRVVRARTGDEGVDARTTADVPGLRRDRLARIDAAPGRADRAATSRALRAALARRRPRQRATRRAAGDHDRRPRAVGRRREVDALAPRHRSRPGDGRTCSERSASTSSRSDSSAEPEWVDSGLVFTMPDGRGWHPDVITRAFARLVERSGLPRIRLHDLRHSHATHLLAAGTNVRVTSERLGHASVAFTLDVYGHVLPGQQADAAAAVAALVDG